MVTDATADELPIIRPLVGMNKDEIERLAKAIGTFELSTSPGVAACGIPTRKPRTHSRSGEVAQSESRLDLDHMISRALESAETADI